MSSHANRWTSATLTPCTSLVDRAIILLPPIGSHATFLDNGNGAGMVSSVLKARFPQVRFTATDISAGMLEAAR